MVKYGWTELSGEIQVTYHGARPEGILAVDFSAAQQMMLSRAERWPLRIAEPHGAADSLCSPVTCGRSASNAIRARNF